jgi:histidine ammonia-lyase
VDTFQISGDGLTLVDLVSVARDRRSVMLSPHAEASIRTAEAVIEGVVESGEAVYGVNTGFGKFASVSIPREQLTLLQHNLLRSHAVGVGPIASEATTRAMLLLRINALALGASGIRIETIRLLVEILNRNVLPVVPEKGSVGASGDLAPLAHLALPLIGEGEAIFEGERMNGGDALRSAGLEPIQLAPKEGLALINGTQLMTAVGALIMHDAQWLAKTADIVGAMSLEAVRGTNRPFDERIHALRPHPGQMHSARNLRRLTWGSDLMASHRTDPHKIQDPYSLRCMPQVHGAARDALAYARRTIEIEMNSATDNPLVFPESGEVVSGGNFHGEPVAIALDTAAIALSEFASISERRIEAMLDPSFSELPPFLTRHAGVDSGYMVSQYTAAALVSENKILSHPASVDSIPTSANQEDHVSMGVTAALKAREILTNTQTVLAIELLCASEGLDQRDRSTSEALWAVHQAVRAVIPRLDDDLVMYPSIQSALELIRSGVVVNEAEKRVGALD